MSRPTETLYTKEQLESLFRVWECTEPVPGKGKKVVIAFPLGSDIGVDLIEVEKTELKSDYKKRLWRVTMSSMAGREFEQRVREAHVAAWRRHLWRMRREAKLEEHASFNALM